MTTFRTSITHFYIARNKKMAYSWIPSSIGNTIPSNALLAGRDTDGSPIYVGRSHFQQDELPCKIIPNQNAAYVSYAGAEHLVERFDVLCGTQFYWTLSTDGSIPVTAFQVGYCETGEPLCVGRIEFKGSLTPGKIHRSHGCLYITYGGREHSFQSHFEVLMLCDCSCCSLM